MCLTANTLLFLIFFSKTNLEGVRHLGYALTTKWMVFGQRLPGVFLTFGFSICEKLGVAYVKGLDGALPGKAQTCLDH